MARRRKTLVVLGFLLLALLALAYLFPSFFNAEAERRTLTARLESVLQRKVKMGQMSLSLFPPSLNVEDAEIAEALGFGNPTFSSARRLRARVNLFPLLRGDLQVGWIELDEPTIHLLRNVHGDWNFSSLGREANAKSGKAATPMAPAGPKQIEVGELRIRNGTLTVADLGRKGLSATYDQINVTVRNFSAVSPFDFKISAHVPGSGKGLMSAEGSAGPLNTANLAATPAQGKVRFEEVDLRALGAFTGKAGLSGLFSGETTFSSDGQAAPVEGKFKVDRLVASPKGSPAQAPLSGRYKLHFAADTQRLELREVELSCGHSSGRIGGSVDFSRLASSQLTAAVNHASLADVAKLLPAWGVKLPAGSTGVTGVLDVNGLLRGPFEHNNGRAFVQLHNARLAGYSLGSQLAVVAKLAGLPGGRDTEIEKLQANLNFVNGDTATNDLQMVGPGMSITGAGNATEAGAMNFHLTATLTRSGAALGVLQRVTGGGNTVPFVLSGTFEHPIVRPDVGRMAQQQFQERAPGFGKILGGLLGKKKN